MSQEKLQVGAYFYPLTTRRISTSITEAYRAFRAEVDLERNVINRSLNEFELVQNAQPLFEGHQISQQYCLPDKVPKTMWDDSQKDVVATQIALAREAGLSYFIFDAYDGVRYGTHHQERSQVLSRVRALGSSAMEGFKYAKMQTLESPRVVLPIPVAATKEGFGGGYREPERKFDLSPATARHIIECCLNDWQNPNYLFVKDRPYLSILTPSYPDASPNRLLLATDRFMDALRTSAEQYGYNPYIVGVMRNQWNEPDHDNFTEPRYDDYTLWLLAGADAVTQYCDLATHGSGSTSVQKYEDALDDRHKDWYSIRNQQILYKKQIPFIPSPAVGWDSSSRGELAHPSRYDRDKATNDRLWEQYKNRHPYRPIVIDGSPELFSQALSDAMYFASTYAPLGEQLVTIFAWNEISEGAVLLPRLMIDGTLDTSYLDAIRKTLTEKALKAISAGD